MKIIITSLLIAAWLLAPLNVYAKTSAQKKLKKIDQQIKTTRDTLTQANQQKSQLLQKLKTYELTISRLSLMQRNTQQKLKVQQTALKALNAKQTALEHSLATQQQGLSAHIRAAYRLGQTPYHKLLLNLQNPAKLSRLSKYYQLLVQARMAQIQTLKLTLTALDSTRQQIANKRIVLLKLINDQRKQQTELKQTYQNRKQLVSALNTAIKTNQSKLKTLEQNKAALAKLIARVEKQKIMQPKIAFSKRKGKFAWPIKGRITQRFGSTLLNSRLKAQGLLISAKLGTTVHAIAPGQVAFAGWMAGYGLLLIINHGQGYMTIYGHNQTIQVNEGDAVRSGQPISRVGISGGLSQPALYFAIRYKGKSLNPALWCSKT